MKPDDPIRNATLSESLSAVYYAIAMALDDQGIELDGKLLHDVIPGLVFTAAVEAHWIPAPPAPTSPAIVPMGDPYDTYYVEAAYRDQFLGLMAEATEFWEGEEEADKERNATLPNPVPKASPSPPRATGKRTPAEWIDWFLNSQEKVLTQAQLVEEASKERQARSGFHVSPSSVSRIYTGKGGKNVKPDILIAVAKVIGCDYRDLRWSDHT